MALDSNHNEASLPGIGKITAINNIPAIDVALVLDRSGSMAFSAAPGLTRIGAAHNAADVFLGILAGRNETRGGGNKHQAAIVSFGNDAADAGGGPWAGLNAPLAVVDRTTIGPGGSFSNVLRNIEQNVLAGGEWTNIVAGLEKGWYALDPLRNQTFADPFRKRTMLLLSDGEHNFFRCEPVAAHPNPSNPRPQWAVEAPYWYVTRQELVLSRGQPSETLPGEICPANHEPTCPTQDTYCPTGSGQFPASIGISTVGVGATLKENAKQVLMRIAADTGGAGGTAQDFFYVSDGGVETKMQNVYMHMLTRELPSSQPIRSHDYDVAPNATNLEPVDIDSSVREATFVVTWASPSATLGLNGSSPR